MRELFDKKLSSISLYFADLDGMDIPAAYIMALNIEDISMCAYYWGDGIRMSPEDIHYTCGHLSIIFNGDFFDTTCPSTSYCPGKKQIDRLAYYGDVFAILLHFTDGSCVSLDVPYDAGDDVTNTQMVCGIDTAKNRPRFLIDFGDGELGSIWQKYDGADFKLGDENTNSSDTDQKKVTLDSVLNELENLKQYALEIKDDEMTSKINTVIDNLTK